jgi:nitrite reductase/ring-hydroxylating ferredoxin subunit/uncharacterized membrane protein
MSGQFAARACAGRSVGEAKRGGQSVRSWVAALYRATTPPDQPGPIRSLTEPTIEALGRATQLNAIGRWLSNTFHRMAGTGPVKDLAAGTWLGHPLHPMLTDITIGAWTSAVILDVIGGEHARPGADTLIAVGILSAVPTAVTGLSDLADITRANERSVGTAHALANIGGLVLWTGSYLARTSGSRRIGTALTLLATAATSAAGFLGGHLSYRKGVGVDQTVFDHRFDDWTGVMDAADLVDDQARRVMVAGTNVFLYRSGEAIHALNNRCSHRGGPLHKGTVNQETVTCPWHASTFRHADGSVLRGPATAPQPAYQVRVQDGKIEIRERPF